MSTRARAPRQRRQAACDALERVERTVGVPWIAGRFDDLQREGHERHPRSEGEDLAGNPPRSTFAVDCTADGCSVAVPLPAL